MSLQILAIITLLIAMIYFAIRASKWEVLYKTFKQLMRERYTVDIDDDEIRKIALRNILRKK